MRGTLLAAVQPAGARTQALGLRARARSRIHLRQSVLVVQYVLRGRLLGHTAAHVSRRRSQNPRSLPPPLRNASRTSKPPGDVSAVPVLGTGRFHPRLAMDRRCGETRRAEIVSHSDARLSAAPRLRPAAFWPIESRSIQDAE